MKKICCALIKVLFYSTMNRPVPETPRYHACAVREASCGFKGDSINSSRTSVRLLKFHPRGGGGGGGDGRGGGGEMDPLRSIKNRKYCQQLLVPAKLPLMKRGCNSNKPNLDCSYPSLNLLERGNYNPNLVWNDF